jgi:RND family efflux transporter MFP subunit
MSSDRLRTLLPLLVLVLGAFGAWALLSTPPRVGVEERAPLTPQVRVLEVAPRMVKLRVQTHGTVAPRTESDLVPQVSGPITWVSPSLVSGGFFEDGEVLLRIDPRDYEAALERARATLVRTESEHDRALKELARRRSLQQRNAASTARVDDAENAERVAGAAMREARAALDQAERDLGRTRLRAPFTGRVREERVGVGQFVNRGSPVARLYAIDYVEVRLPVPDRQLAYLDLPLLRPGSGPSGGRNGRGEIEKGPAVTLSANFAGAAHTWIGRVERTEGEIDARSRMVHVVARVEAPYEQAADGGRVPLAVGLFVSAEIEGREVPDAVVLPRSAVFEAAAEDRGGREAPESRVWVVGADDRLRARAVEVLHTHRDQAVIGGGLAAGQRVVVSPLETAVEGMAVRPVVSEPEVGS